MKLLQGVLLANTITFCKASNQNTHAIGLEVVLQVHEGLLEHEKSHIPPNSFIVHECDFITFQASVNFHNGKCIYDIIFKW